MTHISSLPFEVLITIMKWVVSSDLDLRSLEQCSEVCRGFYLASRSNDVWKPVCLRTWGFDKIPNDIETTRKKNGNVLSWRQFYLTRPRVQVGIRFINEVAMRESILSPLPSDVVGDNPFPALFCAGEYKKQGSINSNLVKSSMSFQ